jgi:uncharacterized membrane protein YfcA
MDGIVLTFFLLAAFAGGVASGLAGFAMGFIVSGIWLHILTPVQTTALIVGYGLLTQGYGVRKLRHALIWNNIAPFIIGGIVGVPIATVLLTHVNPTYLRVGGGVLLVIYGVYGLALPAFKPVAAGVRADLSIGLVNGVLAGLTGLPGFIITVWCQLRGWKKDFQRSGISARYARCHCNKRRLTGGHTRNYARYIAAVRARSPRDAHRPVGRIQALWKA